MKKKNHNERRMTPEELEGYMHFKRRGFVIENRKGKGSYTRKKKHKNKED